MTLSIKNGGYAFLIRLDLMFSMSVGFRNGKSLKDHLVRAKLPMLK